MIRRGPTLDSEHLASLLQISAAEQDRMARKTADYEADKQKLKEFLTGFTTQDEQGRKQFKYAEQLTAIAHREQVREIWMFYIEVIYKID